VDNVRVRMAPSPTGNLHVGSARTALFNFLFARSQGGRFLLRIDDTDLLRSTREHEAGIYEGLRWLGLEWDEGPDRGGSRGPYRQSERLELYREQAARLLEQGAAYRCYCTPEELEAERRRAEQERRPYVYSGRCRVNPPPGRSEFVVRFQTGSGEVTFSDLVRGECSFETGLLGDFIIIKSDGYPTYNFASPIDDALMEITHVIRAEEHLPNTPGQLLVLDALGLPRPRALAHLPLILAPDRTKISKRKVPIFLGQFRDWGYLPEAMLNYLALLGWNPGSEQEIFSLPALVEAFRMERVQRSPAVFDLEKLTWFNGAHIRALEPDRLADRLRPFLPRLDPPRLRLTAEALQERLERLDQAPAMLAYLDTPPSPPPLDEAGREMVAAAAEALATATNTSTWTPENIEAVLEEVRSGHGWSRSKFFKILREVVAQPVAPPIHHTFALLPRAEARSRLEAALAAGSQATASPDSKGEDP